MPIGFVEVIDGSDVEVVIDTDVKLLEPNARKSLSLPFQNLIKSTLHMSTMTL